jgi:amino acid transporter
MAEETKNPHEVAPRGMVMTCVVSLLVGVATLLGILYGSGGNIAYVIDGPRDAT